MLLEFQRDFAAAISAPVQGPMRVYRNTVLGACVDALRANYPAVARLLGEQMFDAIGAEFAAACPPRQPVLALYGARFCDWLEEQPWVADLPYVPDVARIERLSIEALFAADQEPLQLSALTDRDDWQQLHLPLHPATRFDWVTTPAMSIWLAQGEDGGMAPDFDWKAEGVLITRPALEVRHARLDRAGHRFLFGVRLGESVGAAAIATASLYPNTDIASLFAFIVNAGAFAGTIHRSLP